MNVITNYWAVSLTFGSSIDVTCSIFRNEFKREGAGKGNWGGQTEEIVQ